MRGPVHALLWELWRLSRWEFLLRTLGMSAIGCLVFYALGHQLPDAGITYWLTIPMVGLATMMSLFSGIWMNVFDSNATGFCFRLGFTRPINTPVLVGIPMVFMSFLVGVNYLIPALLMRHFCEVFPVVSITAVLVTACVTLTMAVWSGRSLLARGVFLWVVMSAWGAVGLLWVVYHPGGLDPLTATPEGLTRLFSLSPFHYAILAVVYLWAIVLTVLMVKRQRHGETLQLRNRVAALFRREHRLPRIAPPFRGPYYAQLWLDMRRSGIPLLWVGVAGAAASFLFFTLLEAFVNISRLLVDGSKSLTGLWLVVIALTPPTYMLVGTEWLLGLTRRQGVVSLPTFEGTQPIRNTALLSIKLFVLSLAVLAGLALMVAASGIWFALFGDLREWADVTESVTAALNTFSIRPAVFMLLVFYTCIVSYVACSAFFYAGGLWAALRPWLFAVAFFVGIAYLALACLGKVFRWNLWPFWEANAWLFSVFFLALAVAVLRASVRRGYFGRWSLAAILCAWAAYFAVFAFASTKLTAFGIVPPLFIKALAFSSLTLPLTAIASAPLSLGVFRHR